MKKIKIQILGVLLTIISPFFYSCNYLDVDNYFSETLNYDSIFANKINLEKYLWGTAAYFPEDGNIFGDNYTPGPMATDEGFTLEDPSVFRGMAFTLGLVTPTNGYGMDIWGTMYKIIRKTNTIMARMNEATDMTNTDKNEMLGYVHFMRGYAYYHLLMQYGPVVLLGDDVLDNNEKIEYYDRQRATYDESVEYICNEFETAAKSLPKEVPMNFFGRPTKGAAYGLIARVRLQHASPLFNGEQAAKTYFGNWKRKSDNVNYISQTYDEKRWAVAAMAAKRIIDLGQYSLYTVDRQSDTAPLPSTVSSAAFPYGAGNIDPFRSYSDIFTGEALPSKNPEFIWACYSPNVLNYTRYSFPIPLMGGKNCICVTQKVVDAYRMADGRDITNSSAEYPYSETGFVGGADKTFSNYTLKGTVSKMYANREMRFYASIGFSGCLWTANSFSESSRRNLVVDYYYDGLGGKANSENTATLYAVTGYVPRKYIHEDDAWKYTGAQQVTKAFPIIRYAEILLSYVEALNNLTKSYTLTDDENEQHTFTRNIDEIKFYFNQVRFRAGQPGLTDEEASDPETVQKLIERERMVEFLFENRRYYDVRRWGIYEDSENELIMGMNTDADADDYFQRTAVNSPKARNRIVNKKMVFMPISLSELRKSPSLDQNPGWSN
jgi:SusD family.